MAGFKEFFNRLFSSRKRGNTNTKMAPSPLTPQPVKVYRDKLNLITLPPIPKKLSTECSTMANTLLNDAKLTYLEKLKGIYQILDHYNKFVRSFTVCDKGCSACCKIGVNVSQLEAELIAQTQNIPMSQNRIPKNGIHLGNVHS